MDEAMTDGTAREKDLRQRQELRRMARNSGDGLIYEALAVRNDLPLYLREDLDEETPYCPKGDSNG